MPTLKLDMQGADVEKLRKKLASLGFQPGMVDCDSGRAAETELIAFQRSRDLPTALRAVNGASHGLDRFTDALRRGSALIG
jgi:hypothetical protein